MSKPIMFPGLVAAMERHLELRRPASHDPAADLALGVEAARWVFERLTIEPRLDAAAGREHDDRVEVDLALVAREDDAGRTLVGDDAVAEASKRLDRDIDRVRWHAKVDGVQIRP